MAYITVTVKFLNGDLMEIQHKSSRGFEHFKRMIYDSCPFIPYGCLTLQRIPWNNEELDEDVQLMLLPDIYSDEDDSIVKEVSDGDELFALVDTTLVKPVVGVSARVCIPDTKIIGVVETYHRELHIQFFSTDAEENDEYSFKYSIHVFYDEKNNLFALKDTFQAPTPQECAENDRDGCCPLYRPTNETKWFLSVMDCLKSAPHTRFPKDENTLLCIHTQITERAWEQWEEWRQYDDDYEYDQELDMYQQYDDVDDIREQNYEAQRWNRRR